MQTASNPRIPRAALVVVVMFLTVAVGVAVYRLLSYGGITNSAALFIGLPTVLGILLTLCVHPKGLYGTVFKASTLFLLLSGFAFPIRNMPVVIQALSYINPSRYFLWILRGIILRGATLETLWPETLFMSIFATWIIAISWNKMRTSVF